MVIRPLPPSSLVLHCLIGYIARLFSLALPGCVLTCTCSALALSWSWTDLGPACSALGRFQLLPALPCLICAPTRGALDFPPADGMGWGEEPLLTLLLGVVPDNGKCVLKLVSNHYEIFPVNFSLRSMLTSQKSPNIKLSEFQNVFGNVSSHKLL